MCGISGFFNPHRDIQLGRYYENHLKLRHRGKDDEGFYVAVGTTDCFCKGDDTASPFQYLKHISQIDSAHLVLGHRRLSILDLSIHGHQPMSDRSGRYVMVYNGEIYNYRELRIELEKAGEVFKSTSDSEVLLSAYSRWGTDCFSRFNGMWALAIYDKKDNTLLFSRDRFGIKPLYYAEVNGTLYFGSEVKFLLPVLPAIKMNEQRAKEYLAENLVDHHQETMFEGIKQLQPARWLRFSSTGTTEEKYWHLPDNKQNISLDDASDQLLKILSSSIDLRLRSDVPVGSLLSGGLDSTTIVCMVKKILQNRKASTNFECFSAVFHEKKYSERHYIEDTVQQVGMPIHWVYPDPEQLEEKLPDIIYHQEFPFRSLSVYSQWELMKKVSTTKIKVLLNGQGSDELFGGYTHHMAALSAEHFRKLKLISGVRQARFIGKERGYASAYTALMVAYELIKAFLPSGILPSRPIPGIKGLYKANKKWQRFPNRLTDRLSHDLTCSALPEYLRYEDRNSMAFTLESRLPFLDFRLVEWAYQLPDNLKINNADSKWILKSMASSMIPASISARKDKMGFTSPQERWQKKQLKEFIQNMANKNNLMRIPFLDHAKVNDYMKLYMSGNTNNWARIWRHTSLLTWYKSWCGQ